MALRIPLAASIGTRDSALTKDALLLNAYAEQGQGVWDIYKRPGTDSYVSYLGPGQGTYSWREQMFSIFNDSMRNYETSVLYALSVGGYTGQQYQFAQTAGQSGSVTSAGAAWTQQTAAAGWTARQGAAFCVFNNRMWIMGGTDGTYRNDVWSSTDGITWTQATAAAGWAARQQFSVVSYQNQMWLTGGRDVAGTDFRDVWNSTDGITWTQVDAAADFAARRGFGFVVFNNRMWVMGGYNGSNLNDVWSSTDGTTWTQATAAAAWTAGMEFGCVSYAGRMWKYSGQTGGGSVNNECYSSTDGATWTLATAAAAWSARTIAGALTYGGRMWILGGWTGAAFLNEAYSSTDGITWTSAGTITAGALGFGRAAWHAYNNRLWRAGGSNGANDDNVWNSNLDSTTAAVGPTAYLMVKNNNEAWYLTGTTLTQISDADYPIETVPGVIYLDGTFYVMNRAGVIFGSDLEDPSLWNSLNFMGSEAEPDIGIAITKILNYAVALGAWSIECFQTVLSNPGTSPLARIDGAYRQYGCASAGSVAYIENGLVFISQSKLRGREVVRMVGLEVEKISTPSVEKVILADALTTVYSYCLKAGGHEFYVLTLVASAVTLVCDLTNKMWYQWSSLIAGTAQTLTSVTSSGEIATATLAAHGYSDGQVVLTAGANQAGYNGTFIITRVSASVFTYPVASGLVTPATGTITATGYTNGYFRYINYINNDGVDIVQHVTDGSLYQIGTTFTNDNDIRINTRARTGSFDGQTLDNKSILALNLDADTVSANAYIRWTDDDYSTYNIFRRLSLNNPRKQLRNLTRSRRRAFEVMHADDTVFVASSLELNVRPWRI